jgi:hypothetical protein
MSDDAPIPQQGVTIRPGHEGFVARVWPSPPLDLWGVVGGGLTFAAVGVGAALLVSAETSLRVQVALSVFLFGALLIGFAQGIRYMPVEIGVERQSLSWNGERIPWLVVACARVEGDRLRVLGDSGDELAAVRGARPEVATWLAAQIDEAVAEVRGGPTDPPTG